MNQARVPVLFVGPYPPPYSGPEMGMKLFLESSLQEEFQLHFLCTNVRKSNQRKGKFGLPMVLAFLRFFTQLAWLLVRYRPRLVYYPITATQLGWLGRDLGCLFFCRVLGSKTVIHLRASHFRLNYEQFHPLTRWLVTKACRTVAVGIVQANYLHDQFEGLIDADRVTTLYQAIDTEEYSNADLDDYIPGKVLFLGHLTQAKGYCDLLRAIPQVVRQCPHAKFFVAGTLRQGERNIRFNQQTGAPLVYEDPVAQERAFVAGPNADHYVNLGVIRGSDKIAHLRSCDMLVLPSYSEGFSRAIVEAMSVGKPVVYTPVGAHREAFVNERHGLCVPPGNVSELSQAIVRLMTDREVRNRIGVWNHGEVRREFDIRIIAHKLGIIFHQALNGDVGRKANATHFVEGEPTPARGRVEVRERPRFS